MHVQAKKAVVRLETSLMLFTFIAGIFMVETSVFADTPAQTMASRIASRVATFVDQATLTKMVADINADPGDGSGYVKAASEATTTIGYGDSFLYSLFRPMCNLAGGNDGKMDPCTATLMYIAWSKKPYTDAFTGNYVGTFTAPTGVTLPAASLQSWLPTTTNDHWSAANNAFLAKTLSYVTQLTSVPQNSIYGNQTPPTDLAGVLTLPQPSYDMFFMGTNRKLVKFVMEVFLASNLETIKDAALGRTAAFAGIRKDPNALAPSAETLLDTCAGCHSHIDRAAAAANLFDYGANGVLSQRATLVKKIADRETLYAAFPGAVESDNSPTIDAWQMNLKRSPYGDIAWGATSGTGLNAYATSAAATDEYRIGLIYNVWSLACGQAPPPTQYPKLVQLSRKMRTMWNDDVTTTVQNVVALPECVGR